MDNNSLVNKIFNKVDLLKTTNPHYGEIILTLFNWQLNCDQVKNDFTTNLFPN